MLGSGPKTANILAIINDIKIDLKSLRKRTCLQDPLTYHPRAWIQSRPSFCQAVLWRKKPRKGKICTVSMVDVWFYLCYNETDKMQINVKHTWKVITKWNLLKHFQMG